MLSQAVMPLITEHEYLEMEKAGSVKHEFVDGYIFAMVGSSRAHNKIAGNLYSSIHEHLKNTPCDVYMSDVKLKIAHLNSYYYPDIMVGCSREDDEYSLSKPCLIIEVLSPSTASTDRREKLLAYQSISSLKEYCLVNQAECRIEKYTREQEGRSWILSVYEQAENIQFVCMDAEISMQTIYDGVLSC
jgi:Uma2 family endonuclease